MSGLSALKIVQAKRQGGNSPKHARRQKLSNKLHEQIQLAKAQQSGAEFSPVRVRTIKDEATGQSRKVEVPKKIKPWWWPSDGDKLCITVRYGSRTLEVVDGKNAIETDNIAGVITTLQILKTAVDAGELDSRIDAVMGQGKDSDKNSQVIDKRPTLKLPSKAS